MSEIQKKEEWIDWQNTKVLQKAIIRDESGNILIIKRATNRPSARPGKWDLPGGSIGQKDVTSPKPLEVGIKREIREETGLEVLSFHIIFVDSWVFTKSVGQILGIALGYECRVAGIQPIIALSDEHTEYQWITPDEVETIDFGDDGGLHHTILRVISN